MYLLLFLLVPAYTNSQPDSDPSVGINLPHGSITFFGSNFGDSQKISLPNIETSTSSFPTHVTSFTPSFPPYTPVQSNPQTFFKNQQPPPNTENNPSFYSLSYSTDQEQANPNIEVRNPSFSPFTQGPINSAVPFSLFYPEFPTPKPETFTVSDHRETTTHSIPTPSLETHDFFEPKVPTPSKTFAFSTIGKSLEDKKSSERIQSGILQPVKEVHFQTPTRLEDIELHESSQTISQSGSQKKNLQQFWHGYNGKSETDQSGDKISLETINHQSFRKKTPSLNDIPIPSDNRKTRKIDFSSPSAKNITGLIKKALSLVKKVEEIDDRKRTLKSSLGSSRSSSSSKKKESARSFSNDEEEDEKDRIRDLKEERRFEDLKSFIQDQSSISNLIKSETSGLRDLLEARTSSREDTKPTRDMIKALARLNSISSLLLKDNDKTKNTVRELPDEIRNIVQSEIVELKDLLEDQNIAVASALKSAIRAENRSERKIGNSQTEVIILKALAKLNKISGVLLKEQEKTEQQTSSALKALPALAKFIQAETSDIKDLIDEQADSTNDEDLDELKDAISQSLANDKLITRAIIKLNDITQLLLRDVNFTTTAITNKLPEALTALITSETGKIRQMIDLQNDAIVDILKESDNLARAERVIQEAQKIKQTLAGEDPDTSEERRFISESDRILEVLSPLISKSGKSSFTRDGSRADKLIDILTPILNKEAETKEVEEKQNETEAVLKAQLTGQKSIVQALLKLTNITRTLLEDKDKEKSRRERPRSSGPRADSREDRIDSREERIDSREQEEDSRKRVREDRRPHRNQRKKQRFEDDFSEDYELEYYDDDYYLDTPSRKSQSLVERIATSAGNRALKGNQALFEEFVKLAIERQRWEQAQDVTNIIKSTLTTEPPPEESEEYFYSDEELVETPRSQHRPNRKRPNKRPRRPSKKRPTKKNEVEEEYYEDYEYEIEEEPPRKTRPRPSPKKPTRRPTRKPRPARPPRTKPTERPVYDDDEYPVYEEEYQLEESIEEKEFLEEEEEAFETKPKFPAERLKPQRGNNLRQNVNQDEKSSSINDLLNARLKGSRPKFQTPTRGRFTRPGRRNEQRPEISTKAVDPTTIKTNLPKQPTSDKDDGGSKETRRPSFGNSNESGSRLTASNVNAKDNTPSIIEVTTPKVIKVETRLPIVQSKPGDKKKEKNALSLNERDQKRKELKENLLQTLLSHSKKKTEVPTATDNTSGRTDSPRKFPIESKKEEQRSGGLRGSTRGRKFGRGGIPSRRKPQNELETNQKLTLDSQSKTLPNPLNIKAKQKPKSFKESIIDNLKNVANPQGKGKPEEINIQIKKKQPKLQSVPAVPETKTISKVTKTPISQPLVPTVPPKISEFQDTIILPTRSPSERKGSKKPQSQRPQPPRQSSQRPQGQRSQSQRSQSQRQQSQRGDSNRNKSPSSQRPGAQRAVPPRPNSERPRSSRPGSQRPQSKRPGSVRPSIKVPSQRNEEEIAKVVLPLNDEERKSQTNQRNSLLKQLVKNRGDQRQGGTRKNRPQQPTQRPQKQETKRPKKKSDTSALENLFSIISSNDDSKTVVKVTSSSSSSSSSGPNVRIRPHGKKHGKRKKSNRPSNATPTPTEDPSLQNLTPQERLVKKVKETLRSGESVTDDADLVRPKSNRKKVIFRKKKTGNDQLPRSGRKLGPDSGSPIPIKTVKVRVRRIVEPLPFPIVY